MSEHDRTDDVNGPVQLDPVVEKRNRFLGIALGAFVILLGVVSYFRISALSP